MGFSITILPNPMKIGKSAVSLLPLSSSTSLSLSLLPMPLGRLSRSIGSDPLLAEEDKGRDGDEEEDEEEEE